MNSKKIFDVKKVALQITNDIRPKANDNTAERGPNKQGKAMQSKTIFDVKKAARQITNDMRPAGELDVAVLDGLPLEAVEEEDDGHDQGGHDAPRHGPVHIWPEDKSAVTVNEII
jgi:hypothetical protein